MWLDPASITAISNYILFSLFDSILLYFYLKGGEDGGGGGGGAGVRTEKRIFLSSSSPFPFLASLHEALSREQRE